MENKKTRDSQNYKGKSSNHGTGRSNMTGFDDLPENVDGNEPDSPQSKPRAQSVGYTMIAPNEHRWSNLKMKAQKEEEDLQRWKEAQRAIPVHVNPERLGGEVSMDQAREKQQIDLRQSKLQKRLKKEEMERQRRQAEKGELQKMKAEKREEAERLEERRQQQEQRRREQFRQDQLRVNESFLEGLKLTIKAPMTSTSDRHMSSWHESRDLRERWREGENSALQLRRDELSRKSEENQREKDEVSKRDIQLDHRRVNSAFLDKLEAQRAVVKETGEGKPPSSASEDSRCQSAQTSETQDPLIYSNPGVDKRSPGCMEEAEDVEMIRFGSSALLFEENCDPDYDWALMKLESKFPEFSRVFLADILIQCNGGYQRAYTLLSDTCH